MRRRLLILGVGLVSTLGLMGAGASVAGATPSYHNPTPTSCYRSGTWGQGYGPATWVCGNNIMKTTS